MTLVDSIDSILMLYSYTGFPEQRFRLFEPAQDNDAQEEEYSAYREAATSGAAGSSEEEKKEPVAVAEVDAGTRTREIRKKAQRELIVKRNMMSGLSIVLTLMSIVVAFSISFITIMGLVGDKCKRGREAAGDDEGLAGRWWRFWAEVNDNSGYIGAGIVGTFVLVVSGWYGGRWAFAKWKKRASHF